MTIAALCDRVGFMTPSETTARGPLALSHFEGWIDQSLAGT